jgi:hypothetical protein
LSFFHLLNHRHTEHCKWYIVPWATKKYSPEPKICLISISSPLILCLFLPPSRSPFLAYCVSIFYNMGRNNPAPTPHPTDQRSQTTSWKHVKVAVKYIRVMCFLGLHLQYCHLYEWLSTGFWIGFVDHLYTQLVNISNYSAIANFHTLQITRAPAKSFPAHSVFTSSCLLAAPTVAIPLLRAQDLSGWRLPSSWTKSKVKVKVKVILRLVVYRQLVRLGDKPLEDYGQRFLLSTEPLRS